MEHMIDIFLREYKGDKTDLWNTLDAFWDWLREHKENLPAKTPRLEAARELAKALKGLLTVEGFELNDGSGLGEKFMKEDFDRAKNALAAFKLADGAE